MPWRRRQLGIPGFGTTVGTFSEQSETMEVHYPELSVARTAVLDYFQSPNQRRLEKVKPAPTRPRLWRLWRPSSVQDPDFRCFEGLPCWESGLGPAAANAQLSKKNACVVCV